MILLISTSPFLAKPTTQAELCEFMDGVCTVRLQFRLIKFHWCICTIILPSGLPDDPGRIYSQDHVLGHFATRRVELWLKVWLNWYQEHGLHPREGKKGGCAELCWCIHKAFCPVLFSCLQITARQTCGASGLSEKSSRNMGNEGCSRAASLQET